VDPVIGEVPRSQIRALVVQDHNALKKAWPVVQVFLVSEATVLAPVVTPLNATIPPPTEAGEGAFITPEGKPTHIVNAKALQVPKVRREPMLHNRYRVVGNFIKDWRRISEEEKVCIQIGDDVYLRVVIEDVEWQRWCAGKIVFDHRAILLSPEQLFIPLLNIFEADQMDIR